MKKLILIVLSAVVFTGCASNVPVSDVGSDLCLNRAIIASAANTGIKEGRYSYISGSNFGSHYAVPVSSVIGEKEVSSVRVRWAKQYNNKREICIMTKDHGSFCHLVADISKEDALFSRCQ